MSETFLPQWREQVQTPSPAKLHEYALQYPVLADLLLQEEAHSVFGIGADEARFEIYYADAAENRDLTDLSIYHLGLDPELTNQARGVLASEEKSPVKIVDDYKDLPSDQDAAVMNVILGCLGECANTQQTIADAAAKLRDGGIIIVTTPNPDAKQLSSYSAEPMNGKSTMEEGEDYAFTMTGFTETYVNKKLSLLKDFSAVSFVQDGDIIQYYMNAVQHELAEGRSGMITEYMQAEGLELEEVYGIVDKPMNLTHKENGIPMQTPEHKEASDQPAFYIGVFRKGVKPK